MSAAVVCRLAFVWLAGLTICLTVHGHIVVAAGDMIMGLAVGIAVATAKGGTT